MKRIGLALLMCLSWPAMGQAAGEAGWIETKDGSCKVWASAWQKGQAASVSWDGACEGGKATGQGTAEFYHAGGSPVGSYSGLFQKGLFVGKQAIALPIRGLPHDEFAVELQSDPRIVLIRSPNRDASYSLCTRMNIKLYAFHPEADIKLVPDPQAAGLLEQAIAVYTALCPVQANIRSYVVAANAELFHNAQTGSRGSSYGPVIASGRASVNLQTAEWTLANYRNDAAKAAAQAEGRRAASQVTAESIAEAQALSTAARERMIAFSKEHGVERWLYTDQVQSNPFIWKGKVIGVRVKLRQMLSPNQGLLTDGRGRHYYSALLFEGLVGQALMKDEYYMAAIRVDGPGGYTLPDPFDRTERKDHIRVDLVALKKCEKDECMDYVRWIGARGQPDFEWGKDQSNLLE